MTTPGEKFEKQEGVRWLLDHIEERVQAEEGPRYQFLLRALGAWLDQQGIQSFAAMETDREFRIITRSGNGDSSESILTFAKLLALEGDLRIEKLPLLGRYQDSLRALGFELDVLLASGILLEEIDEDLLVSYLVRPPDSGLMWKKHHVVINPDDRSKLMGKAVSRRTPEQPVRFGRMRKVLKH